MADNNDFVLPLLERLKILQENRKRCLPLSDNYLITVHSGDGKNETETLSPELESSFLLDSENQDKKDKAGAVISFEEIRKKIENNLKLGPVKDASKNEVFFDAEDSKPKFPFLKKGEGISRFKTKRLKGFKKHSEFSKRMPESCLKIKKNPESQALVPYIRAAESKRINEEKVVSPFEKLEELAERDSFCSTSSNVQNLLEEESLLNSSPFPIKASFLATLQLTPIRSSRHNRHRGRSPTRTLFPATDTPSVGPLVIDGSYGVPLEDAIHLSNPETTPTSILKRNALPSLSSPLLKVKFEDRGVRVLEYDDYLVESESVTLCSEDTDLISVSDLENLAFLNYNVNVIREESPIQIPLAENLATSNYNRNQSHEHKIVFDGPASGDYNNIKSHSIKPNINPIGANTEDDGLDAKALKLLLLAKVNDLKKEIDFFKKKNVTVDTLAKELEEEKTKLREEQRKAKETIDKRDLNRCTRPKMPKQSQVEIESAKKLQELNDKVRRMDIENKNLRRRVLSIEKEKEEIKSEVIEENKKLKRPVFLYNKCNERATAKIIEKKITKITSPPCENSPPVGQLEAGSIGDIRSKDINQPNPICKSSLLPYSKRNASSKHPGIRRPLIPIQEEAEEKGGLNDADIPEARKRIAGALSASPSGCDETIEVVEVSDGVKRIRFANGDEEITLKDRIIYRYKSSGVKHTTFNTDGRQEVVFLDGQTESYFRDGSYQVVFPGGACVSVYKDGSRERVCRDGSVIHTEANGARSVLFPNGQKEVFEAEGGPIRRIYPDGTVKTLFEDGSLETIYATGRVRIKDPQGNVTMYKNCPSPKIDVPNIKQTFD